MEIILRSSQLHSHGIIENGTFYCSVFIQLMLTSHLENYISFRLTSLLFSSLQCVSSLNAQISFPQLIKLQFAASLKRVLQETTDFLEIFYLANQASVLRKLRTFNSLS